jgi:hypothetical protein
MPMTVTTGRIWDMACSLSGCLWPAYRWLGGEHGRTIPLTEIIGSANLKGPKPALNLSATGLELCALWYQLPTLGLAYSVSNAENYRL